MTYLRRPAVFAYIIAGCVVILDQTTKAWVLGGLDLGHRLSVDIWGPLWLTLVQNRGVSFGLLQSDGLLGRFILAGFSLSVVVFMAIWVRRANRALTGLVVGLIMGGAFGNVIDRLRFGSVVDFVDIQRLYFPWVFNLADSAISIGIALLLVESLILPKSRSA
jgi:signal peptidase II